MIKKIFKSLTLLTLAISTLFIQLPTLTNAETKEIIPSKKQLCVGYLPYYRSISSVDANSLTHLNFAFGYIYHNETLPRQMNDPSKTSDPNLIGTLYLPYELQGLLKKIPELKKQNPNLKTLLSLGGWGGRGFCSSSSTKENRVKLANSIKSVIDSYGLDGVDIDWECPVNGGWGEIQYCSNDKLHYTLLIQELRAILGNDKLITIAAGPGYDYRVAGIDFLEVSKTLDFINIMTYGYSYGGPKYDAALYKTSNDPSGLNTENFMKLCEDTGVPKEKLVMGVPFFAKVPTGNSGTPNYISTDILRQIGLTNSSDYGFAYGDIKAIKNKPGVVERWDNESKNPYLVYIDPVTKYESFITSFDNAKSMAIKSRFAKDKGYGGVMIWEVGQDSNGELMNAVYNGLYTNFSLDKTNDLNNDGIVNINDLSILASNYNAKKDSTNFNPIYDLNNDNIVDIYDLVLLSRSFSRI